MAALDTAAALITLAAAFNWLNHRFIRVVFSILVQGLTLKRLLRR